jgi:hypothetical protein
MDNDFSALIDDITKSEMFYYIVLLVGSIFIASFLNFGINVVFCICVIALVIYYKISKKNKNELFSHQLLDTKFNTLHKKPEIFRKHKEFIEFFYSINDFYPYSPDVFDAIIDNVASMLLLYEDVKLGVRNSKQNYNVAVNMKVNALNHLHNLIYSINPNHIVLKKLHVSMQVLNKLLTKYLINIANVCNEYVDLVGLNTDNGYVYDELTPANTYEITNLHHSLDPSEHEIY